MARSTRRPSPPASAGVASTAAAAGAAGTSSPTHRPPPAPRRASRKPPSLVARRPALGRHVHHRHRTLNAFSGSYRNWEIMKLKIAVIVGLVVLGVGAIAFVVAPKGDTNAATYLTATVERGDVSDEVAATGSIAATARYGLAFRSPARPI